MGSSIRVSTLYLSTSLLPTSRFTYTEINNYFYILLHFIIILSLHHSLQGIWGDLIHTWLDKLLPQDADVMASEKLHILVTPVPSFGKKRINKFETREDLINCNLASVHLPWFLNGDMTKALRGQSVIDGSFLAKPADYFDSEKHVNEALILDFKRDPVMRERSTEFVKVRKGKQFIWDILEQGRLYANIMDKHGEFRILPQ